MQDGKVCALNCIYHYTYTCLLWWWNCGVISRHLRLNQLTNHKVHLHLHSSQFCVLLSSVSLVQPHKLSVDFWRQSWLKPSHFRIIRVVYILNSNSAWNSDCSHVVFHGILQSCRRLSECNTETEGNCPATFTFLKCEQPSIQYDTSDTASLSLRFIL